MPSRSSQKASSPKKKSASVRPRSIAPPLESPLGALLTFGLLWSGILLLLALISYTPNDVPAGVPFVSHTTKPNDPAHNLIGVIGAIVAGFHYFLFGAGSYLVAVGLCWFGLSRFVARIPVNQRTVGGLALLVLAGASFAHLQTFFLQHWQETYNIGPGGSVGQLIGSTLRRYLGGFGAHVVLFPAYAFGLVMLTGYHPLSFVRRLSEDLKRLYEERKKARWEQADELERVQIEERRAKKEVKASKRGEKQAAKKKPKKDGAESAEDSAELEEEEEDWELVAENSPPEEATFEGKPKKQRAKRGKNDQAEATAAEAQAQAGEADEYEYEYEDGEYEDGEEEAEYEYEEGEYEEGDGEAEYEYEDGEQEEGEEEAEYEYDEEAEEAAAEAVEEEGTPAPKIIDGSARRPKREIKTPADSTLPVRASFQGVKFENYQLPPLDLLHFDEEETQIPTDQGALLRNQNIIVETLGTFGLEVFPGDITRGPTITRYEIYPSKGLRVSRITTLEPDIARATKAERINIIAPIPGKDTVGIEIANKDKVPVPLRELLDDPAFRDTKYKIPLALGKDVYGNAVLADLASMPHLLVAGATGSGKSVCINSIIASLLFQFSPEQLRFIMIDPKVVEMQIYNDLPHLVVPVVTDPKKVILALRWVVKEMERRYKLFAEVGKRNFDAFNARDLDKPAKKPRRAPSKNQTRKRNTPKTPQAEPLTPADAEVESRDENVSGDPVDAGDDFNVEEPQVPAGVAVASGDADGIDDDEDPPFFVHPVNLSDSNAPDPDLAGLSKEGDTESLDEEEDGESGSKNDTLPPHEFASPDEPEIPDSLPYIVVIIDELADLMQTAPADVELAIGRITQMARAAGIHLIVATQTPRADVITGTIKANIPCRIAFQVSSGIDSRVILDAKGADRLVGKGDMLYLPPGSAQLIRAQGALVSDDEIQDLVECCREQGEPVYEQEVQDTLEGKHQSESSVSEEDEEILTKCLEVIQQEKRASTSLMQRRLGLGYTRAARMMDILEERGYVGPGEGAKPREILMDNIIEDSQY